MNYRDEIMKILAEANPDVGLASDVIARHVYNMTSCDLFSSVPYEKVKAEVACFLRKESSIRGGVIAKGQKRGSYCLNSSSPVVQQLMLEFEVREEDEWMM